MQTFLDILYSLNNLFRNLLGIMEENALCRICNFNCVIKKILFYLKINFDFLCNLKKIVN